jgi:lipopolysaccharide heptosyltransferase I
MDRIKLHKIPKKILIVKPSSLGDVVHSLPFLDRLNNAFPKAEIHWVIAAGLEGLLEGHPMVRRLWVINKDQWKQLKTIDVTLTEIKSLFSRLKDESFDLVVDLQGLLRSGLITYSTRSSFRIGFREAREGGRLFYTHKVAGERDMHAVDRYLRIAEALGCGGDKVIFPMPLIKDSDKARRLKERAGRYAVLAPGARWQTKIWPAERFGALAAGLDLKSIVVGSGADVEKAEKIEKLSGGKAVSAAGDTDLRELISIIRDASLAITNDSGPMHIAAACGIPVVALFGPTNPVRTGPYGDNHIIVKAGSPCAPCYGKRCPDLLCMKGISVEDVRKAVTKILQPLSLQA